MKRSRATALVRPIRGDVEAQTLNSRKPATMGGPASYTGLVMPRHHHHPTIEPGFGNLKNGDAGSLAF